MKTKNQYNKLKILLILSLILGVFGSLIMIVIDDYSDSKYIILTHILNASLILSMVMYLSHKLNNTSTSYFYRFLVGLSTVFTSLVLYVIFKNIGKVPLKYSSFSEGLKPILFATIIGTTFSAILAIRLNRNNTKYK